MPEVETKPKDDVLDKEAQEDATKSTESADDKSQDDDEAAEASQSDESSESDEGDGADADDDEAGADKSTTGDDSTRKNQNRLGFQLRQIRQNDPYVAQVRRNLQDNFVGADGLTDEQREIRQLKANEYIKDVETKRAQLVADNAQVASEIPMFKPNLGLDDNGDPIPNPEFNKKLYDRALQRYGRDSLEQDEQGEITGFKIRLLDYMREEADAYLAGVEAGRGKSAPNSAVKDKQDEGDKPKKTTTDADRAKMDAASESAGGTSPTTGESKKDPMIDAFFSGFDSVK